MKKLKRKVKTSSQLKGLTPGIRMKGGVGFDPTANGFVAIVHTWDNPDCQGEPEEWCAPEIFSTELGHALMLKKNIFSHRKLEE